MSVRFDEFRQFLTRVISGEYAFIADDFNRDFDKVFAHDHGHTADVAKDEAPATPPVPDYLNPQAHHNED